ncbi:zinc finger, CCHC-type containing protein [Tanacetum coccineum]
MRLHLFQFSLRDQASNWLKRLPVGSISIWEDLTTQFFPLGSTVKLHNKILMFHQHQGESLSEAWTRFKNDSSDSVKPVKAIYTPQSTLKTPERRLLGLEDQINFLLKGSQPTPRPSSTHVPQAYAEAVYLDPHLPDLNEPPKQNPFTFRERTSLNPQPQALGTTFEAQWEKINNRMTEMFRLLKNSQPEEKNDDDNATIDDRIEKSDGSNAEMPLKEDKKENEAENETKNKPIKSAEKELTQAKEKEAVEAPSSQPVRGPVYEAILKKKITKKEDTGGNFKIPCNIGNLKHINALVDQGSDINIMPLSTYRKLTNKRPTETDIRLSLASHSYIYPLGIAKDVIVDVVGYVYPIDFVILDIKEDEKRPFILGMPFLTTAKAVIKFDKGIITLRSGKSKMSFHKIPESHCKIEKGIKNDIEHISPTMTINRLVLEWEERIKLHQEKEMKFDQWRSKTFKNKHPALVKVESEMNNEREVT